MLKLAHDCPHPCPSSAAVLGDGGVEPVHLHEQLCLESLARLVLRVRAALRAQRVNLVDEDDARGVVPARTI